jgi:lipopolysaccharide/colanic/teichoic acid biosynthesis glycosyltransferase
MDITVALVIMPFILIIVLIVGILIYSEDKGSIFYNAQRLGLNGKVFKMFKFRTMKMNAPDIRNDDGSTFNSENDPRLTKIGRFLRTTSIDELPQLLNVLIGDMSLVGPRPDLPEHIKQYDSHEMNKLNVRPGITGYNQAYFRNTIPWKDRIKNDLLYIDHLTFLMDIKVILKTIERVLRRKDVYIE